MDLLDQMRTFVQIVDAGSLSAAALARRMSVPAVSRQLAALEDDLETALILRSTRRLQVTPAGRRWYQHCQRLLRGLDDARADVAESDQPRGNLVVSAPITFGVVHVVPVIERLARRHPGLSIDLRLEDHFVDLLGDAVDVAIRGGTAPPDSGAMIAHPILQFARHLVAAPAYLRRRGSPRDPAELTRHDCLVQLAGDGRPTSWTLSRAGELREVVPQGRLRSSSPLVLREWAVAGAGIALIPSWLVSEPSPLRKILPGWSAAPAHVWALHRIELRGAPRTRALLAAFAG